MHCVCYTVTMGNSETKSLLTETRSRNSLSEMPWDRLRKRKHEDAQSGRAAPCRWKSDTLTAIAGPTTVPAQVRRPTAKYSSPDIDVGPYCGGRSVTHPRREPILSMVGRNEAVPLLDRGRHSDGREGCGRLTVYRAMAKALRDPNPPPG